jgi:hypothetical protein
MEYRLQGLAAQVPLPDVPGDRGGPGYLLRAVCQVTLTGEVPGGRLRSPAGVGGRGSEHVLLPRGRLPLPEGKWVYPAYGEAPRRAAPKEDRDVLSLLVEAAR